MNSILWHDYETTGTSPALDRPLQFAAIRTDEDLNVIGEPLTLYCRPSRDTLPHPDACLITGITPQRAEEQGVPEPQFIGDVHEAFMVPGTCGAGYNSLRFDDEVTRHTLYRNFYDPYEREWRDGNSRWDIIDMLRLTHALRPEGIQWPQNEDGFVSFRLELLTRANGISHQSAHDALSDVHATIAMARLVRERQPRLYEYAYSHRSKLRVASLIDVAGRRPFLHVSSKLPRETGYTALMAPLCEHPLNKNAVIAWNLSEDPAPLLDLTPEEVHERVFTAADDLPSGQSRLSLKAVHLNRCPVVATPKLLDEKTARRLGISLADCEAHWQTLRGMELGDKLQQVFGAPFEGGERDVEARLYDGFPPPADKSLFPKVRQADPGELAVLQTRFSDPRYRELLFRYRARFHPETLSPDEQLQWEEWRFQRLTEPAEGRLTLDQYFARIDTLEAETEAPDRRAILEALREWGDEIL